jgi:uncharacterized membrane protein
MEYMENLIVVNFNDLLSAREGLKKLNELDQLGDITIYNYALISKTDNKKYDLISHEGPDTSGLPVAGVIGGSLIGIVGGPIGVAIGMLTGAMVGSVDEENWAKYSHEVLDGVKDKLKIGSSAIIVDAEEDVDYFIDSYMKSLQGTVVRTKIADQYDQFNQEQWNELNDEIDAAEKELGKAVDKNKATIKAKIEKLKREREDKIQKIKIRTAKRKRHIEEKVKAIDDKLKKQEKNTQDKLKAHRHKLLDKIKKIDSKMSEILL